MSQSDAAAPAAPPIATAPVSKTDLLSSWLQAATHGAALVYDQIVAIESKVSKWETSHPEIGPLIASGTSYAMNLLGAAGIPVPAVISAGTGVMSALRQMAAHDATLDSGR